MAHHARCKITTNLADSSFRVELNAFQQAHQNRQWQYLPTKQIQSRQIAQRALQRVVRFPCLSMPCNEDRMQQFNTASTAHGHTQHRRNDKKISIKMAQSHMMQHKELGSAL